MSQQFYVIRKSDEDVVHAKYIDKYKKNGKWVYVYEDRTSGRLDGSIDVQRKETTSRKTLRQQARANKNAKKISDQLAKRAGYKDSDEATLDPNSYVNKSKREREAKRKNEAQLEKKNQMSYKKSLSIERANATMKKEKSLSNKLSKGAKKVSKFLKNTTKSIKKSAKKGKKRLQKLFS